MTPQKTARRAPVGDLWYGGAIVVAFVITILGLMIPPRHGGHRAAPRAADLPSSPMPASRNRLLSDDERELVSRLDSLGREADYLGAIPLAEHLLELRRARGATSADIADAVERRADLDFGQGVLERGIAFYREALGLRTADPSSSWQSRAALLNRLARAEKNRGLYDEAMADYGRALSLESEFGAADGAIAAQTMSGMANVIRRFDARRGDAIELLERALEIRLGLFGEDNEEVADTRSDLALVLLQLGRVQDAEEQIRKALPTRRRTLGPDHPDLAFSLSMYAWSLFRQERFDEAEPLFREAARIGDVARSRSEPGINRLRYRPTAYLDLAATLLAAGRTTEAWPMLERALSLFMVEQIQSEQADSGSSAERPRVCTLSEVQAVMAEDAALVGWLDVNMANELPSDLWGYVIRKQGPVHWVRLGVLQPIQPVATHYETVYPRMVQLERAITSASEWPANVSDTRALDPLARAAWEERMAGLEPFLTDVHHVVVIWSKGIGFAPIEAMRGSDDRDLAERFSISYSSSASLFALMRERASLRGRPTGRHALLIGDPPFSDQQLAGMLRNREPSEPEVSESLLASNEFREGTLLRDALAGNRELLHKLPRLTWTHLEVMRISGLLSGATVLLGADASEEELTRLSESGALSGYDTIHLATHALRDVRLPQFAAFVLSQVGNKDAPPKLGAPEELTSPAGAADGLLMPEEIAALHLKADLVTLSGCATTGFREFGAYVGLSDAFLRAGASTTVASLWRVEDRATSLLMQRFYARLAETRPDGSPVRKDEALRDAKLWLRDYVDEEGRTPYRHPAYWSSFVLVGDPGL